MTALRKFLALDWDAKLMLFEALFYLGVARLALLTIPFRHISRRLGQRRRSATAAPADTLAPPAARKVGWAVELMARHTPWESACLTQAIAGKFMLRRRGIPNHLSLGMKKDANGKLAAHAWLQAGEDTLLGATRETFTPLSTFSDP